MAYETCDRSIALDDPLLLLIREDAELKETWRTIVLTTKIRDNPEPITVLDETPAEPCLSVPLLRDSR